MSYSAIPEDAIPSEVPAPTTSQALPENPQGTDTPSTSSFTYQQIFGETLTGFNVAKVNDAPFVELCPGGNCFDACQDYRLLLDKGDFDFDEFSSLNTSNSAPNVTLFGLCTNLAAITSTISTTNTLDNARDYFPIDTEEAVVSKMIGETAACLYGTCQATRHPDQCIHRCLPSSLQSSTTTYDLHQVYSCTQQLCSNTCGLPFADQDVFGIGVLASFAIQAGIIVAYATFCLIEVSRPITVVKRLNRGADWMVNKLGKTINTAAAAFLAAECFFAATAAVAAFRLDPLHIDPLNGYPLLLIATIGFIPPIFTLMLLHSQNKTEWYNTTLVLLSWTLSTVLFFILLQNLWNVRADNQRIADSRNALFKVDICGGYSAMSLCQENGQYDPLHYMMGFFNHDTIPNINNIAVLWLYATFVLGVLLLRRGLALYRKKRRSSFLPIATNSKTQTRLTPSITTWFGFFQKSMLPLATILFFLAFGYQVCMVKRYLEMDLIDTSSKGWTFGQIVALLLWVPLLIDLSLLPALTRARKKFYPRDDSDEPTANDPLIKLDVRSEPEPEPEPRQSIGSVSMCSMGSKPVIQTTQTSAPVSPLLTPLPTPSTVNVEARTSHETSPV